MTISPQSQHHHYHNNTITIWKSRTKASFSHLPLSLFQARLARKLRFHILHFHFFRQVSHESFVFHIFHFHFFRQVSHESFVFTSSTFTLSGKSRTKASLSHLPLSLCQASLARKLRFHILHFHFFRQVSHESFVFTSSTLTFSGKSRTKASFSHLPLSLCQGSLARKLRFHILHFHFFRQVSHESFVFTSSTLTFSGKSRTKASFSHLPLSLFQASLARKLRFHIFSFVLHFHFFRQVSHESFVFTSSDFFFSREVLHEMLQISDAVARSSFVLRNSVFADRIVMAASRLLGAAAVCLVLWAFLQYWSGCIKAAKVICQQFFPRASERRVLLIVGVCQTFSHLHILKSSHLLIFTSHSYLIFTSSLLIFTSSHSLLPSCSLALLPSCSVALLLSPSFLFLFWRRGAVPTRRHDRQKLT